MHRLTTRLPAGLFPLALIILTPFILFWRWVIHGEVLFWGTILLQFWPWHHLVKQSLLEGQWPLWNPLLGNGTPLLANLQSAVFYPPNFIQLVLPTAHALTFSIIIHLIMAGVFMFFYARHLGLSAFPATISALAYMFSGYITGRTQFIVMVHAAAWIPLLLLFSDRLSIKRRTIDILWLALILAIQMLAGHAQLWFYSVLLVGVYVLFRSWRGRVPDLWYPLTGLAIAVISALLLAAVQILPTAEFLANSPRSVGAERHFALTYSFWPWRFISLIAPNFFGHPAEGNFWGYGNYWEDHAYIGILPFVLALIAIWHYGKARYRQFKAKNSAASPLSKPLAVVPFFVTLALISLLLALGRNSPIYLWAFEHLPGIGLFQAPARFLIWYTVAMAVLAGIGAQFFVATPQNRPNWRRFLAGCVALTLAGLIGETFITGRDLTFLPATRTLGILLVLSVSLLLIQPGEVTNYLSKKLWRGLVVIFVATDLILVSMSLIPTTSPAIFKLPIESANVLKAQPGNYRYFVDDAFAYTATFDQYFRFESFGPKQVEHWQQFKETLAPNFGVYAPLPSANNNDPLVVKHWRQLIRLLPKLDESGQANLLSLMNVGYLVNAVPFGGWPVVYDQDTFSIQQLPAPLPRAYFVTQVYEVEDIAGALSRLDDPDFDSRREVVIIKDKHNIPSAGNSAISAEFLPATVVEHSAGQVQLKVDAPSSGYVVLTDTFYPGWQATVDGQAAPIQQANVAFRAVWVEAGRHNIQFGYRPSTFTFGLWTTLVACLIIGVALVRLTRQQVTDNSN